MMRRHHLDIHGGEATADVSELALGRLKMAVQCSAERIMSLSRLASNGGGWRRLKFNFHLGGVAVGPGAARLPAPGNRHTPYDDRSDRLKVEQHAGKRLRDDEAVETAFDLRLQTME